MPAPPIPTRWIGRGLTTPAGRGAAAAARSPWGGSGPGRHHVGGLRAPGRHRVARRRRGRSPAAPRRAPRRAGPVHSSSGSSTAPPALDQPSRVLGLVVAGRVRVRAPGSPDGRSPRARTPSRPARETTRSAAATASWKLSRYPTGGSRGPGRCAASRCAHAVDLPRAGQVDAPRIGESVAEGLRDRPVDGPRALAPAGDQHRGGVGRDAEGAPPGRAGGGRDTARLTGRPVTTYCRPSRPASGKARATRRASGAARRLATPRWESASISSSGRRVSQAASATGPAT